MRKITTMTLAVITLVSAGCSGESDGAGADNDARSTPSPVSTVSQPASQGSEVGEEDSITEYIDALATQRPAAMRDGLAFAVPDSEAWAYLHHQANTVEANLDGGFNTPALGTEVVDDGFRLCDDRGECGEFTGLQTSDGKVSSLLVDGESPGPRLTLGDGSTVEGGGMTVEFLSAYRTISSEALFVTMRISTADESATLGLYTASYRAPDGRQRQTSFTAGPGELGADSTATAAVAFPGSEPGGTVTFDVFPSEDLTGGGATLTIQIGE